jgi:hypothetical protein
MPKEKKIDEEIATSQAPNKRKRQITCIINKV